MKIHKITKNMRAIETKVRTKFHYICKDSLLASNFKFSSYFNKGITYFKNTVLKGGLLNAKWPIIYHIYGAFS